MTRRLHTALRELMEGGTASVAFSQFDRFGTDSDYRARAQILANLGVR
jgi:hypothetical protein